MSDENGPTQDQVEKLVFTGTVKRRVSLLVEAIKMFYAEDLPGNATEVEAWHHFLKHAVKNHQMWTHLAPALVVADAIRTQTDSIDRLINHL